MVQQHLALHGELWGMAKNLTTFPNLSNHCQMTETVLPQRSIWPSNILILEICRYVYLERPETLCSKPAVSRTCFFKNPPLTCSKNSLKTANFFENMEFLHVRTTVNKSTFPQCRSHTSTVGTSRPCRNIIAWSENIKEHKHIFGVSENIILNA